MQWLAQKTRPDIARSVAIAASAPNKKATTRGTHIAGRLLEAPLQDNHVGHVLGGIARTRRY
eukprot:8343496-Prorocentrum_lima.AAC.1